VKSLAEQTAKATQEIAQHITGIQSSTGNAVASVKEVAVAMRQIDEVTTAIASAWSSRAPLRTRSRRSPDGRCRNANPASSISTVNAAIGRTSRSATTCWTLRQGLRRRRQLAAEVQAFFVGCAAGPLDRRRRTIRITAAGAAHRRAACRLRAADGRRRRDHGL